MRKRQDLCRHGAGATRHPGGLPERPACAPGAPGPACVFRGARTRTRARTHAWIGCGLLGACLIFAGCTAGGPGGDAPLGRAEAYYTRGDYAAAERHAQAAARRARGRVAEEAHYLAGLSARRLGRAAAAARHLERAAASADASLAAEAKASLGMVYGAMERHAEAAEVLLEAAAGLSGEDRARAYYHAGLNHQRLGRWGQARTALVLARGASDDPAFRARVNRQLQVSGFTVQVGAFRKRANARRLAESMAGKATVRRYGAPRLVPAETGKGAALVLVQIGRFSTHGQALEARRRLGRENAIVVPLAGRDR